MTHVGLVNERDIKFIGLSVVERKIPMVKCSSVSNGKLNTLPCLHIHPINLVVYQGTFATSSNET